MTIGTKSGLLLICILLAGFAGFSQKTPVSTPKKVTNMKTYLIEREIPNAGKLTAAELKSISQTSCAVLDDMGPSIQWIHSYVAGNKIYCIYKAENEELIRKHAEKGGFPANTITEVASIISPETAK